LRKNGVVLAVASTSATCSVCGTALEDRSRRYCSTICRDRARQQRVARQLAVEARAKHESTNVSDQGKLQNDRMLWAGAILLFLVSLIYLRRRGSSA
jgi:predicted nucleic acid-binding Zn ribbon protein